MECWDGPSTVTPTKYMVWSWWPARQAFSQNSIPGCSFSTRKLVVSTRKLMQKIGHFWVKMSNFNHFYQNTGCPLAVQACSWVSTQILGCPFGHMNDWLPKTLPHDHLLSDFDGPVYNILLVINGLPDHWVFRSLYMYINV